MTISIDISVSDKLLIVSALNHKKECSANRADEYRALASSSAAGEAAALRMSARELERAARLIDLRTAIRAAWDAAKMDPEADSSHEEEILLV